MPGKEKRVETDTRYDQFARRTSRWLRVQSVWLLIVGAVSLYLLIDNANQASDIQGQRRDSIMRACAEQNARHDDALAKLDRILKVAPDRRAAQASRRPTVTLIDALVPVRNCGALVERSVK